MKWNVSQPANTTKAASMGSGAIRRSDVYYPQPWDVDRSVREALERVTWVYRCVDAIASNQANLPLKLREGDRFKGKFQDAHPLYKVFNQQANIGEHAIQFRYRLSAQFLLSRQGVFIYIVRSNGGDAVQLVLLPPDQITVVPDSKKFVKEFVHNYVEYDGTNRTNKTKKYKPEDIIWIRRPHPFNQYMSQTPLESAGLAIETEWLAKLYNRNFLNNDGRPGGIVVVRGAMEEADAEELRARFSGGVSKAGRITVITSDQGADFVDTATTPRDAQYQETRKNNKDEILMAFGVPESVLANAAGRTYDNADAERLIFWHETMKPHLNFISAPMDVLDENENLFAAFDTSGVDVLQRAEMKRREYTLREFDGGAISINEYREDTGREPVPGDAGSVMFVPKTKVPYVTTDGSELPKELMDLHKPAGRPNSTGVQEQNPDQRVQEGDTRLSPLPNTDNSAPDPQSSSKSEEEEIEVKRDYELLASAAQDSQLARERWEFIAKREVGRIAERMSRVLSEKIGGPKFKRAFLEGDSPIEKIFDNDTWMKQFSDDLLGVQKSAYNEGYSSVTGSGSTDLSLTPVSTSHIKSIVEEFRGAVAESLDDLRRHNDFRRAPTDIASKVTETAENLSTNAVYALVSDAYNKGVADACVKSGLRKMWWGNGDDLHLKEIEPDELFTIGKTSYRYPPSHMNGTALLAVSDD